tara:strand:- start:6746 stop:7339 length:594 start_codon:yes stop_codon:yes gene_type:complete
MEDTPIEITHLSIGEGAKGNNKIVNVEYEQFYIKQKGSGESAYPTTLFCPKCSDTHEFNAKFGEWREKWNVNHKDLYFTIKYDYDENGDLFAICDKCGFDLREDYIYGSDDSKKELEPQIHTISIMEAKYQDNAVCIGLSTYKKVIKEGINWKSDIIVSISGSKYRIKFQDFSNPANIVSKGDLIYIKWKCFRNHHL